MSSFEVLQEKINALKSENDIVHDQLAQQIENVSQMLIEERRRTNGSLDKISNEMQHIRETLENKISALADDISELKKQMYALAQNKNDWRNSYIITFLSTLCGILLTYVITSKF